MSLPISSAFQAHKWVCLFLRPERKWWNWQTHHLEGVAPKGVGVQIPPSAPEHAGNAQDSYNSFQPPKYCFTSHDPRKRWAPDVTTILFSFAALTSLVVLDPVRPIPDDRQTEASGGGAERKRHGVGRDSASVVGRQDAQSLQHDQEGRLRQVAHSLRAELSACFQHDVHQH